MPPLSPAHLLSHLDTDHIGFLHSPVPQSHVVDTHNRNFRPVLDNNTFFHAETAANHLPTVPDGSVRAKEFLCKIPYTYWTEVQSGSDEGDKNHPQHHSIPEHFHVSIHDEQYPRKSYAVDKIHSETKR